MLIAIIFVTMAVFDTKKSIGIEKNG